MLHRHLRVYECCKQATHNLNCLDMFKTWTTMMVTMSGPHPWKPYGIRHPGHDGPHVQPSRSSCTRCSSPSPSSVRRSYRRRSQQETSHDMDVSTMFTLQVHDMTPTHHKNKPNKQPILPPIISPSKIEVGPLGLFRTPDGGVQGLCLALRSFGRALAWWTAIGRGAGVASPENIVSMCDAVKTRLG
jgi:hypothetical protein